MANRDEVKVSDWLTLQAIMWGGAKTLKNDIILTLLQWMMFAKLLQSLHMSAEKGSLCPVLSDRENWGEWLTDSFQRIDVDERCKGIIIDIIWPLT